MNGQGIEKNEQRVQANEQGGQANEQGVRANELSVQGNEQAVQASEQGVQENEQSNGQEIQVNELGLQTNEHGVEANEQGVQMNEQEVQGNDQESQENEQRIHTNEDELEQESVCVVCLKTTRPKDLKFCMCNFKIHHKCLKMMYLYWERWAVRDITGVKCINCNANIKLTIEPKKSLIVKVMEKLFRGYMWLCNKLFTGVIIIVIQQALTTYGLAFLYQIYRKQIASSITNTYDLVVGAGLCQSIPLFTIAISLSGWEDTLLVFLRRCSRLPVVGWVFPREYPGVRELLHRHRFHRLHAIVDGLLLPLYAEVTGLLVCSSMEHGLQRLLLGAAAFLSVRGALYMYCRQSRYNIIANRSVANFRDQ